ncbi:hypothetical protein QFZ27_003974 [Inquilinus ginsengisoli]|uniref:hypothetical protein n=1 Tax=Inquilinus ginsengisoli TaxID=363840 RepID=UPI003D19576D
MDPVLALGSADKAGRDAARDHQAGAGRVRRRRRGGSRAGGLVPWLRAGRGPIGPGQGRIEAIGDDAAGEADLAAQPPDQGCDRQGGVGEVGIDAVVLGQPFPEIGGEPFPGLGLGDGDGLGQARGDGLAPAVLPVLPPVGAGLGLPPRLLPLPAQPGLQRDGAADAAEQAAEVGLGLSGAVEIVGLEGGHDPGLEAHGHRLGASGHAGQHRQVGLVRGRRSGRGSPGLDPRIDHPCIRTKQELKVKRNCGAS